MHLSAAHACCECVCTPTVVGVQVCRPEPGCHICQAQLLCHGKTNSHVQELVWRAKLRCTGGAVVCYAAACPLSRLLSACWLPDSRVMLERRVICPFLIPAFFCVQCAFSRRLGLSQRRT